MTADESTDKPYPVRLGPLRATLQRAAIAADRSLHAEVFDRLQRSETAVPSAIGQVFDLLDLPPVQRARTTSTTADLDRLLFMLRTWRPDRLILGRRPSTNNNNELTAVVQGAFGAVVMDTSYLNMARTPREYEIQALFVDLDRRGQMGIVEYCVEPLPQTRELSPADALQTIIDVGEPRRKPTLKWFLQDFAGHKFFNVEDFQAPRANDA